MARLKSLTLASAAALGVIGSPVWAADLPPRPLPPPPPEVVELGTGWYLRGDVGGLHYFRRPRDLITNASGFPALDHEKAGNTAIIGAGIGYQFNDWFRADITADYRLPTKFRGTRPNPDYLTGYLLDRADLSTATFLLNGYVDLGTWMGITPYIGAGVGTSVNWLSNYVRETYDFVNQPPGGALVGSIGLESGSTVNLAWAAIAGFALDLGSGWKMDVSYRYVHLGGLRTALDSAGLGIRTKGDLSTNELRIGARYAID